MRIFHLKLQGLFSELDKAKNREIAARARPLDFLCILVIEISIFFIRWTKMYE